RLTVITICLCKFSFFFQAEDGIRDKLVTGVQTCALPILGTLSIALGTGAGANSRRPLGLSVVGGLIFAQIVTLYLTPVFYTYMRSEERRVGKECRYRWSQDD